MGGRVASKTLLIHKRRVHRRVAKAAQIRKAALEASAVHDDARVAVDRTARRAEGRHTGRRIVRVQDAAARKLLTVQCHLHAHRLVLEGTIMAREGVAADLNVLHQMRVDRRARTSAKAKLPVRLRRPTRDRQVANEHRTVVHDAQTVPAHRDHHRHEGRRRPQIVRHRLEHLAKMGHDDARSVARQHRHAKTRPQIRLAKRRLRKRTVHEARPLGAAVQADARVTAAAARHAQLEVHREPLERAIAVNSSQRDRANLAVSGVASRR